MRSFRAVLADGARDVVLNTLIASPAFPRPIRWRALAICGLDVGRSAIASGGHYGGRRIRIGRGSFLNVGVLLDNSAPIDIGERVQIGPGVMLLTGSHELGGTESRAGADSAAPIRVGRGSWIGARVTVLPGVTIGEGCVIGAGAVVTQDCLPHGVYAGVPARRVRDL